jgi:hypothetical protein
MLNAEPVDFVVGLIMGWIERQTKNEKGGSFQAIAASYFPLSHIASHSLLRNMREALKETTLNFCIPLIRPTHHPGYHFNRRIIR